MESWSHADTAFMVALFIFGAIGVLRGFIRCVVGIFAVIVGFTVAAIFYRDGAMWISIIPTSFQMRCVISFSLLYFFGYAIIKLIGGLFRKKTEFALIGPLNRVFGFFFGILQGLVLVMVVVTIFLLSPSHEKFQAWASQGVIAPTITEGAEALASRARKATEELRSQFIKQMLAWGVKESALDKIFADPELMKNLVAEGTKTPAPNTAVAPPDTMYDQIQLIIDNDLLNSQQKAREIWRLILESQQTNPAAKSKPEPMSRSRKP